ncbi:MAG: hypothetical protein IT158_22535 [Bryobacterales bacterium]|nr:hypothetical protein [Bryobacterales bacterium]
MNIHRNFTRRSLLAAGAGAFAVAAQGKKTVAAIVTEYRYYSHADVICGRILEGYHPNNVATEPRTRIVSMYTDQIAPKDMSRDLAAKHGFKIYPTIEEAVTLGTGRLAVDAVLLVGEHGSYPTNEKGQTLYPRHELMQQIVEVFRKSGRTAPLFCDKHLSYSWQKARQMYDWSKELKFPFMAGSSIPVTVRVPELEIPYNARIEGAVSVGYGGLDAYGFHSLETLQCMIERRRGGETGIRAVRMIEGGEVWNWRDGEGRWSIPILEAALATSLRTKPGRMEDNAKNPAVFVLEYRDGLKAATYMLNGHSEGFLFGARLADRPQPVASHFGFREKGHRALPHFDGLVRCIEELFVTGKPVYPVERTLLTTGALAFLFESRGKGRVETPELAIRYRAPKDTFFQRA